MWPETSISDLTFRVKMIKGRKSAKKFFFFFFAFSLPVLIGCCLTYLSVIFYRVTLIVKIMESAAGITPSSESHFWARATPVSHGRGRGGMRSGGVVKPKLMEPVASCAGWPWGDWLGWFFLLHVHLPEVWTTERGKHSALFISDELIDPLWVSIIVGKHWCHILSVENETWHEKCEKCFHWAASDDWMVSKVNNAIAFLHRKSVSSLSWLALQFLKTSQDHLWCSDGGLVSCSSLSAVLLSNPGI